MVIVLCPSSGIMSQSDQSLDGIFDLSQQRLDLLFTGRFVKCDLNFFGIQIRFDSLNALQFSHFHFDGVGAVSAMDGGDGISYSGHGSFLFLSLVFYGWFFPDAFDQRIDISQAATALWVANIAGTLLQLNPINNRGNHSCLSA